LSSADFRVTPGFPDYETSRALNDSGREDEVREKKSDLNRPKVFVDPCGLPEYEGSISKNKDSAGVHEAKKVFTCQVRNTVFPIEVRLIS
jgi:hypothetical protein